MRRLSDRATSFGVGIAAFVVYAASANFSSARSIDTAATTVAAWRLAVFHTLKLQGADPTNAWIQQGVDGYYSNRSPGIIAWGTPFQALLAGPEGPSNAGGALSGAVASALAIALLYVLARKFLTRPASFTACAIAALGTSTWTVSADDAWTHGPAQALLLAAMLLVAAERWWSTAAAWSLAILVRPHLAVVAVITAGWCALRTRRALPVVATGIGLATSTLALLAYQNEIWGVLSIVAPGYDSRLENGQGLPNPLAYAGEWLGAFLSPERGLLVLSPMLILLLPGLRRAWSIAPDWARASGVGGMFYTGIQLALNPFDGGSAFYSYRISLELLATTSPLLLLSWREWTSQTTTRSRWFIALSAVSIGIQAIGAFGRTTYGWAAGAWSTPSALIYPALEGAWRLGVAAAAALMFLAAVLLYTRIRTATPRGD